MKNNYSIQIFAIVLILFLLGCSHNENFPQSFTATQEPITESQQRISSLLNMSDLELIKKSADYLKSHGENLVFKETQTIYMDSTSLAPIFENSQGEDVYYQGNYLAIHFYPDPQPQKLSEGFIVFIGDKGKVLGYTRSPDRE